MKYFLIWISSYYILETAWQAWEINKYGEIKPDNFDGMVGILLISAITYIVMLLDNQ